MKVLQVTKHARVREPFLMQTQARLACDQLCAAKLTPDIAKKYDVLLAEYGWTGARIAEVARAADVPLIVRFHGADAHANLDTWSSIYKEAGFLHVAGPSEFTVRHLRDQNWAPNIHRFRYAACVGEHAWNPLRVDPFIVWVGRDVEKKCPDEGLRAMQIAAERCKNLRVIQHKAWWPWQHLLEILSRAMCLVHSSAQAPNGDCEGMPVTILEALAIGTPVVAYDHAGICEIVHTEHLVPEHDVKGLAGKIMDVVALPGRYQRLDCMDKYKPNAVRDSLCELLHEVVDWGT